MASLGELFVKVGADISGFKTAMGDVNTTFKNLDSEASKATAGFQAMGQRLSSIGASLSATLTLPIVGLGTASVITAGQIEQTETAFTNFLGSGERARAMLEDLKQFAASTPFEFSGLTQSAKRLMAMGFEAEKVIPMLRTIGDAVAGIGGGAAEIDRVTLALGQMQAKGKVSAQEMNQLAELGIPAWQMLADQIGISIPEAMKKAELGAISSAEAIPAILAGMNEKFGGLMEQQSKTLLGQWSNFKDQLGLTLQEIGNVLLPFAKRALEAIQPVLGVIRGLAEAFAKLPEPVQTAIVGAAALVAALGPVVFVAGQLMSAWAMLAPALVAVKAAFLGLTAVATPLLIAVSAIVAAFGAWKLAEWLYENFAPFKALVDSTWQALKNLGAFIKEVLVFHWQLFKAAVSEVWDALVKFGSWFADFTGIKGAVEGLGEIFSSVFGKLATSFGSAANKLAELTAEIKSQNAVLDGSAIKSHNIKTAYDAMGEAAKNAAQPARNLALKIGDTGKASDEAKAATEAWKKQLEELKKKALKEAKEEAAKFNTTLQATAKAADEAYRENEDLRRSIIAIKTDLLQGRDAAWAMEQGLSDMKDMLEGVGQETTDLGKLVVPEFARMATSVDSYKTKVGTLANAYESLGIKTKAELEKIVADTEAAKNAILGDEDATEFAKKTAIYKALEAQRNLAIALGSDLPEEQKKLMEKLKQETDSGLNGKDGIKGKWEEFSTAVGTIVGNFATDIGKALFDGDLSWGEKFKSMLKDLAGAVVSVFITPATQAIATFVSDVLQNLLHGNFSAIGGLLGDLGQKIKDIFTVTPSVPTPSIPTPTNPTIPGAPGGGGGGGALDAVGAIGSIATAVSSIIGNFQNMAMNKSLDIIVKHTLQTVMILETTFYWVTDFLGQIRNGILDSKDRLDWMSTAMTDGLDSIHQRLLEIRTFGIQIELAGAVGIPVTVEDFSDAALARFSESANRGGTLVVQSILDGKIVANSVIEHLEDNGIVLP